MLPLPNHNAAARRSSSNSTFRIARILPTLDEDPQAKWAAYRDAHPDEVASWLEEEDSKRHDIQRFSVRTQRSKAVSEVRRNRKLLVDDRSADEIGKQFGIYCVKFFVNQSGAGLASGPMSLLTTLFLSGLGLSSVGLPLGVEVQRFRCGALCWKRRVQMRSIQLLPS